MQSNSKVTASVSCFMTDVPFLLPGVGREACGIEVHGPISRIADQIGDWRSFTGQLADLPLVLARGQFVYDLTQFLWAIGAQARDDSIEEKYQGDDWNQIGTQQTRPAEGTNPRSVHEHQQNSNQYNADGRGRTFGDFKYADAFAGVDGILQDGASILGRKMVERGKHRSQPFQCAGNVHGVDGFRVVANVVVGRDAHTFEGLEIWVFIGEPNLKVGGIWGGIFGCVFGAAAAEVARKVEPRAASAGTHVDDGLPVVCAVRGRVDHALQQRGDGRVGF